MTTARTRSVSRQFIALALACLAGVAAADDGGEPFDLLEIRVLGNTTLAPVEIERAVYPSLGPHRTIKEVEQARDALVALYRERGFGAVFVDIPEQDVKDGLVRLQVSEGRLDRVRISGARYFLNGRIRERLPALARGEVLNTGMLQTQLAQVNQQTRDRSVLPVLRAGRTPGLVDLDLKVSDHVPLHGSVDVNNRYTANTSQTRVGASLSYDNLFQRYHSLSLQYQTSPSEPSETRVIAATYAMPLGDSRSLALYAVDTNSDVAAVGTLSVLGAGRIYGARYSVGLTPGGDGFAHSLSMGLDFKDFQDQLLLVDSTDTTPVKYISWSGLYSASLNTHSTSTSFSIGPTFGIRDLQNHSDQFAFKRYRARPNFFYVRANAQHERPLLLGTRLFARVGVQLAAEPLISNEQLSLGGDQTVRGYLQSDALGDDGYNASLEWRSPSLIPILGTHWTRAYLFAFFDAGTVRVIHPLPSQIDRINLSSWGAGFHVIGLDGLDASFEWARPRTTTTNTTAGESRIHFDVTYAF